MADSRQAASVQPIEPRKKFRWVITSPPYYGMRTYRPDQWLRNWFLGGPDTVDYSNQDQVVHESPEAFAGDLLAVWRNLLRACSSTAQMVIRFGGIADRNAEPLEIIKGSLAPSGWTIKTIIRAGTASNGRRQADGFLRARSQPLTEYDVWASA